MIQLPVIDTADQKFSLVINGQRVSIRIRYNATSARWSFDLSIDGDAVVHGRRIVTGVDLLAPFNLNVGVIFAFSERGGSPDRTNLPNGNVKIYHATRQEVEQVNAA